MKFIISIILLGLGISGLLSGLIFQQFTYEIFLGMVAPLTVSAGSILFIQKSFAKNPEGLTASMTKAFFLKMILFAIYFIIIFSFYSFEPIPFVLSFTGFFILFYVIEATFLQKLFKMGK